MAAGKGKTAGGKGPPQTIEEAARRPGVLPRYMVGGHWTPRHMRKGRK